MIFKEFSPREYCFRFPDDKSCMEYLADIKWSDGYHCRHCGHTFFMPGKKAHSRRCKSCKYDESATSHTLLHKLKFPIAKAFGLIFAISSRKKSVSTLALSEELELHYETCLNFRRKVQSAMASSGNFPLTGKVEADETAIGGYDPESQGRAKGDKKLIAVAIERRDGQIGCAYTVPIAGYSAKEIERLIDANEELKAKVEKLLTIKGVGLITVAVVVAETQGFSQISNEKQLASYVGYDVVQRESGTSAKGKTRISKKGNRYIRNALYFPAIIACRLNPHLKNVYTRLVQKKAVKMVAQVAIQRKLLLLIYALWKSDSCYIEGYKKVA